MNPERRLLTVGVYGFSEPEFFHRLLDARVDLFVDIRARRGMRGSEYAFANSARLQARLAELGIGYRHVRALAPTEAVRDIQKAADRAEHQQKRTRHGLSDAFIAAYQAQVLDAFDAPGFLATLDPQVRAFCLFCVERDPLSCHRSLAAAWFAAQTGISVEHLI